MILKEEITVNPLFVGLTRPPMRFGVTITFLMLNGGLSLIIFLISTSFAATFVFAALMHAFGFICCLIDPRFFDILIGKLQCANGRNKKYWHCNSYEAF